MSQLGVHELKFSERRTGPSVTIWGGISHDALLLHLLMKGRMQGLILRAMSSFLLAAEQV